MQVVLTHPHYSVPSPARPPVALATWPCSPFTHVWSLLGLYRGFFQGRVLGATVERDGGLNRQGPGLDSYFLRSLRT